MFVSILRIIKISVRIKHYFEYIHFLSFHSFHQLHKNKVAFHDFNLIM